MKFYSKFSKMIFSLLMVLFLMASAASPALAQTGGTGEQTSQQPVSVLPQAGQVEGAGVTYNPDTVYVAAVWSDASVHFLDENLADLGSFPIGDANPNGIAADGLVIYTGHFSTQSVRAFDYSGNFLFSWTDSRLNGLQGLELVNGELAVFSGGTNEVHFFTTNGSYIRSIPGQGYTTEGLAFDGNLLWSLADSLVGVDPVSGASISTIPNAASGCPWGGSGITASAPGVLTLACADGTWFHVSSLDGAVLASGNNGLNMYGLKYAPLPLPDAEDDGTLFYEDFENGYADWTFDSLWNPENEADTCGSLVAPFPSPTNAVYFGQDGVCNYATGNLTGTLTLNTPIDLPADISPSLTFGSYENTEGACGQYDRRFVEVSTDGGGTWDTLGEMCNEDAWYQASLDLTPYAGQSVLLRFHFITGDDFLNEYFGWMVDDVLVNYSPMPFVTDEDTLLVTPSVLDNDSDPDGNPLFVESYDTSGLMGSLSYNGDGTFTYNPVGAFDYLPHGAQAVEIFTYVVSNTMYTDTASVFILVTGVDDAPVAAQDFYSTAEDTDLNVPAPGVLDNDYDPEGDPIVAELVSGPALGSLSFNADGSFDYTPVPDYHGVVTFTYAVTNSQFLGVNSLFTVGFDEPEFPLDSPVDGHVVTSLDGLPIPPLSFGFEILGSPSLSATFTMIGPGETMFNTPPNIEGPNEGTLSVDFGENVDYAGFGFLVGCVPTVSNAVTVTAYAEDMSPVGTFYADGIDGGFSFAENWLDISPGMPFRSLAIDFVDYCFGFTVDNLTYGANLGSTLVTIEVTAENDAPVAGDQVITTTEDTAYVGLLTASDADGDLLSFSLDTAPVNGSVEIDTGGVFTYTPDANFNGADTFTFSASDGSLSDLGLVTVTVTPESDAPVADDQVITTNEDTAFVGLLTASDADGDLLSFSLDTAPVNGSVEIDTGGVFTYTPDADYNGADSFIFSASDGSLSDLGQVSVTVTPENDAPVADDQVITTTEDTAFVGLLTAFDADGDLLSFSLYTAPVNGSVEIDADGVFTYTPDLDYFGTDPFTFSVSDGELSDLGNVHVTVTPENGAPVVDAGEDQLADEGALVSFSGTYSLGGLQGVQAVEIAWDFGDGTTASGTLTPTHTYAEDGYFTVTLVVTDDLGGVGMDSLLVSVANVAPVISAITDQNVQVGEAFTVTALLNDPGLEDLLVLDVDWGDGQTGSFDLQPGPQTLPLSHAYTEVGSFTVTVTVADDDGDFAEITFTVNVTLDEVVYFRYLPLISK